MLSDEQIIEQLEICAEATPGPWIVEVKSGLLQTATKRFEQTKRGLVVDYATPQDGLFIVAAREHYAEALEQLATVTAERDRLRCQAEQVASPKTKQAVGELRGFVHALRGRGSSITGDQIDHVCDLAMGAEHLIESLRSQLAAANKQVEKLERNYGGRDALGHASRRADAAVTAELDAARKQLAPELYRDWSIESATDFLRRALSENWEKDHQAMEVLRAQRQSLFCDGFKDNPHWRLQTQVWHNDPADAILALAARLEAQEQSNPEK